MPLKLMFITNSVDIAKIAQDAGVDRIWIDMEWIGKDERQKGLNTVKSHHTIEDIKNLRPVVNRSELLVRINPINEHTKNEVDETIEAGADIIMLPMFKTIEEVNYFIECVNKRVKTMLLIETPDAVNIVDELIKIKEIDEFHIGLNDLSIAMKKTFMFDLLKDGIVDHIIEILKKSGKPYGFGGIARIGKGLVKSEYVIREHYRLGSTRAILSRSFANVNIEKDLNVLRPLFINGVLEIRNEEKNCLLLSKEELEQNKEHINILISDVDERLKNGQTN